jgi:putative membrane-bound dehydrogenase-like protein
MFPFRLKGMRAAWLGGWLGLALFASAIDPAPMQNVLVEGIPFAIPKGTTLEQVAAPELCTWPIVAAWDGDGNLVVAESVWNRESVQQQLISRPHRIVRLLDDDGDGRFDSRQVVAESLSFPEGILCLGRDMLVSAPPEIWKLSDADGDGVCESREVWFDGGTLTHCANDLHGPWLGPDGWVYWSKSAFAEQTHTLRSGEVFQSSASHLYRRHPKGGPVEPVMTGGMDNLVDVAWLPNGERFFCATFLHHPRHAFRDGIGHAMYGAVFGKPHAVLDGHPRTGPLMDPTVELGPAAPAGLLFLNALSGDLQNSFAPPTLPDPSGYLLCAQFNLHKVSAHALATSPDASGYTAQSIDLIRSPRIDFHPVDVLLDRDGSLLVVDTGGWYDLCCPSSGTDQRVALGGIYRLRGATPDRWSSVSEMAQALVADPEHASTWKAILTALNSSDASERLAALHLVSLYRWEPARAMVRRWLDSEDAKTVRLAAECLGRLGIREEELGDLLRVWEIHRADRGLQHAILYGMIEGATPSAIRSYLDSAKQSLASVAAVVLDQKKALEGSDAAAVCRLASGDTTEFASPGWDILARHPEWAEGSLPWLEGQYASLKDDRVVPVAKVLLSWSSQASVQRLVQECLEGALSASPSQRACLLTVVRGLGGRELPVAWGAAIAPWVQQADTDAESLAEVLSEVRWPERASELLAALQQRIATADPHASASWLIWSKSLPGGAVLSEGWEPALIDATVSDDPQVRRMARETLRRVRLNQPASAVKLLSSMEQFGPLELPIAIEALVRVQTPELDRQLLARLQQLDSAKTLNVESCVGMLRGRDPEVIAAWKETLQSLQLPPEDIAKGVERWLSDLPAGDAGRGYQVFRSDKAACSACHQIGYVGGNVGPVLSQIGRSRSRRDLIEAIVYPSARLEQSYRSIKIRTLDGEVFQGLVTEETSEHVQLQVSADRRATIAVADIEVREPSQISIMPAGLDQQLTRQELADLIAFLENAK